MESVFTLTYPEHAVAEILAKLLPKNEGYAVSIPLSRQQKGFDLLVFYSRTHKVAAIQVKSSRSYKGDPPKRRTQHEKFNYYLWFKTFDYKEGEADFYVLFGLYPKKDVLKGKLHRARLPQKWWQHKVMLFRASEMQALLAQCKKRRSGFFNFGFDGTGADIYLTRPADTEEDCSQQLLDREKVNDLKTYLGSPLG